MSRDQAPKIMHISVHVLAAPCHAFDRKERVVGRVLPVTLRLERVALRAPGASPDSQQGKP